MSIVKPLSNKISGKVITYKNFHYNLDDIPDVIKIITDTIDDDIEKIYKSLNSTLKALIRELNIINIVLL